MSKIKSLLHYNKNVFDLVTDMHTFFIRGQNGKNVLMKIYIKGNLLYIWFHTSYLYSLFVETKCLFTKNIIYKVSYLHFMIFWVFVSQSRRKCQYWNHNNLFLFRSSIKWYENPVTFIWNCIYETCDVR